MRVQPVGFTSSGIAATQTPGTAEQPVGLSFRGFTTVTLYNGQDNTGDVVAVCSGPGVYQWAHELYCENGLYVEVLGTGKGTVWLA